MSSATGSGTTPETPRRIVGRIVALPLLVLALLVVASEADTLSMSGWGYVLSLFGMATGAGRGRPWQRPRSIGGIVQSVGPGTVGVIVLVLVASLRIAGGVEGPLRLGPGGGSGRVLSRLFEERDATILGARWIDWLEPSDEHEIDRLADVLEAHYPRMGADPGWGTPILPTYLGSQSAEAFDVHVIEPNAPPALTLVFLHGAAGGFSLMCWEVAQGSRDLSVRTVCPAMGPSGFWAREGRAILDAVLAQEDGPIVLAGLSNGAIALSRIAGELSAAHPQIVGWVLVSGVAWDAEPTALPTLILHGTNDRIVPIEPARRFVELAPDAELVELASGHFALLENHVVVERELRRFLSERLR